MCEICRVHAPTNTCTVFKSCFYFFSVTAVTHFLCLPLCLAAHSHSLSCFSPFCMSELRSQFPVQEGNPILSFCTCSQIPSLNQAGIVLQLMERESWGKLWWVIINQPAMKTSRYSKHEVQQDDSSVIHYLLYFLLHSGITL